MRRSGPRRCFPEQRRFAGLGGPWGSFGIPLGPQGQLYVIFGSLLYHPWPSFGSPLGNILGQRSHLGRLLEFVLVQMVTFPTLVFTCFLDASAARLLSDFGHKWLANAKVRGSKSRPNHGRVDRKQKSGIFGNSHLREAAWTTFQWFWCAFGYLRASIVTLCGKRLLHLACQWPGRCLARACSGLADAWQRPARFRELRETRKTTTKPLGGGGVVGVW